MSGRGKRQKMQGRSSSRQSSVTTSEPSIFQDLATAIVYEEEMLHRPPVQEKKIDLAPGDFPEISDEIIRREWGRATSYPRTCCVKLAREFYAHAKTKGFVHINQKTVSYTREAIAEVLELPRVTNCQYAHWMSKNDWDAEKVRDTLCHSGDWVRNPNGAVTMLKKKDFRPIPRAWATYVQQSVMPSLNSSDMAVKRSLVVYAICTGRPLDLASVIHDEIQATVTDNGCGSIGFISLIGLLCERAGVKYNIEIPLKPKAALDKAEVQKYVNFALNQPHQPQRPQRRPLTNAQRRPLTNAQRRPLTIPQRMNHMDQKLTAILQNLHGVYEVQRRHNFILNHMFEQRKGECIQPDPPLLSDEALVNLFNFEDLRIEEENELQEEVGGVEDLN